MEEMAPAEATSSLGQDVLPTQQEVGELTLEKLQDDLIADRAERDKRRARADWQAAQQRAEEDWQKAQQQVQEDWLEAKQQAQEDLRKAQQQAQEDLRKAQQQAQEDWLETKQRAQEDLRKAKQRAREALQTAQQQADEDFQLALRRTKKDRHEADDNFRIVRERYDELSQVSSKKIEKLECERNQAVIDRDRAIAEKEQAIADKDQALADKEQALANKKQATTESSSRTLPATGELDQLMSPKRQRGELSKAQKRADNDHVGGLDDVSRELEPSKHSNHIPQRKSAVLRTRSVQESTSADPMINNHHDCHKTSQWSESDGLARDGLCTISCGLEKVAPKMEVAGTSVGLQASSQARINSQVEGGGIQCSSFGAISLLTSSDSVISNQTICEGSRSDHGAEVRAKEDSSTNGLSSAASQSSPLNLNEQRAGPAVASSFTHFTDDRQIQTDNPGSHGTRSIVKGVSRDSSHLNEPHGTGTVYWFRDVVHGAIHGQTNHASADAVRYEVECFLNAGIRPEQITVMAWSPGQTSLIKGKLRRINPLSGRADDVHVVFVEDFGDRESDIIIADLVMADERTHHSNYVSQKGDAKSYKATKTRKTLMALAKDSTNLEIGFAQATHGFVMIGQSNWLMRWPKFKGLIDKHPYAEIVRDAWRRKVHLRDTTHRDTHPNVVQKLQDLGSVEVSRRAAVADAAHLEFFKRLINAGPKISRVSLPKKNKQAAALQRAQADEGRAKLQQRAATRQQIEEELWQEAHDEEDS